MLLHILNNGIAMALNLTDPSGTLALIVYGLLLVLAIITAVLVFKKFRQQQKEGGPPKLALVTGAPLDPSLKIAEAAGITTAATVANSTAVMGAPTKTGTDAGADAAPLPRAHPFAIAFTSPWLIILLALGICFSLFLMLSGSPLVL
jgi:uncharacterized iron-regulated membrane protein